MMATGIVASFWMNMGLRVQTKVDPDSKIIERVIRNTADKNNQTKIILAFNEIISYSKNEQIATGTVSFPWNNIF